MIHAPQLMYEFKGFSVLMRLTEISVVRVVDTDDKHELQVYAGGMHCQTFQYKSFELLAEEYKKLRGALGLWKPS